MENQQSQTTYFLWDRRVLGLLMVFKRIAFACTLGSAASQNWWLVFAFAALREGLSALTDYTQADNPVKTTNQSSPPNPPTDASLSTPTV